MTSNVKVLLATTIVLVVAACSKVEDTDAIFVLTKNRLDTLIVSGDKTYLRRIRVGDSLIEDKGIWFYDQDRLWFNGWVRRGESSFGPYGKRFSSYSCSFDRGIDGQVKEIYFDVDDYYFYKYLRSN